jgi:hypothetical protein
MGLKMGAVPGSTMRLGHILTVAEPKRKPRRDWVVS